MLETDLYCHTSSCKGRVPLLHSTLWVQSTELPRSLKFVKIRNYVGRVCIDIEMFQAVLIKTVNQRGKRLEKGCSSFTLSCLFCLKDDFLGVFLLYLGEWQLERHMACSTWYALDQVSYRDAHTCRISNAGVLVPQRSSSLLKLWNKNHSAALHCDKTSSCAYMYKKVRMTLTKMKKSLTLDSNVQR